MRECYARYNGENHPHIWKYCQYYSIVFGKGYLHFFDLEYYGNAVTWWVLWGA